MFQECVECVLKDIMFLLLMEFVYQLIPFVIITIRLENVPHAILDTQLVEDNVLLHWQEIQTVEPQLEMDVKHVMLDTSIALPLDYVSY